MILVIDHGTATLDCYRNRIINHCASYSPHRKWESPSLAMDEDDKQVFYGVLGLYYTSTDLTRFVSDNYKGSDTTVAIIEEAADGNYMISSSTGTSCAKKVLVADTSQPCPPGTWYQH